MSYLIAGLGTPNRDIHNRHSIGFTCVTKYAERHGGTWHKFQFGEVSLCHTTNDNQTSENFENQEVLLLRPSTPMNESGKSIASLLIETKLSIRNIIVIHDDADLPLGRLRIRLNGSSGGHGGIKSIDSELKDSHYIRLKIGIGRPSGLESISLLTYVLQDFGSDELKTRDQVLELACDAIDSCVLNGINVAMTRFNNVEVK